MTFLSQHGLSRRVALACALALAAPCLMPAGHARAAEMSTLDRLVAKDEINEKLAMYSLLADGDGEMEGDPKALIEKLMTKDVLSDLYQTGDGLASHKVGWAEIEKGSHHTEELFGRHHYMVSTNFDELTPTTAKTSTSALYVQITKNLPGNAAGAKASADACGDSISHSAIYVYQIDCTKTADGWRMSHIALRRKS